MSDHEAEMTRPLPALMSEADLARRWGRSLRTLQRLRAMGRTPPWMRIGVTVRYRHCDVCAFETALLRGGVAT